MTRVLLGLVTLGGLGGLVGSLSGCGEAPPLTFRTDPAIETLYEPAAAAMTQQMDAAFGQPLEPVVWESLPARLHAAMGEVAQEDDDTPTRLELDLEYQAADITPGQEIVFTLGDHVGAVRTVVEYDAEDEILEIDRALPAEVDGEMVAIGPGHIMQQARPLYARHCQHCHGVSGDGNGPTAWSMQPKPRDFRQGKFKFTSTRTMYKPARADLMRTLNEGIAGTYMPNFKLMPDDEKAALIEYVIWLANRGEVEDRALAVLGDDFGEEVVAEALEDDEMEDLAEDWADYAEDFPEEFADWGASIGSKWNLSERSKSVITPKTPRVEPTAESVARGRAIYLSDSAKCASCHGETAAGNGPQTYAFQRADDGDGYNDVPGLHDDWGEPIAPRNLLTGIYRGGRRPIDLYRRIYSGINGSKMPGFGSSLTDEQIWDVVNYVYAVGEDPDAGKTGGSSAVPDDVPKVAAK